MNYDGDDDDDDDASDNTEERREYYHNEVDGTSYIQTQSVSPAHNMHMDELGRTAVHSYEQNVKTQSSSMQKGEGNIATQLRRSSTEDTEKGWIFIDM